MTTLLYFGSGIDFTPLSDLSHVNQFIYVDAQPKQHHYQGRAGQWIDDNFLDIVAYALDKLGWTCQEQNENHWHYRQGDREFHYCLNGDANAEEYQNLLDVADILWLRGYLPEFLLHVDLFYKDVYVTPCIQSDLNLTRYTPIKDEPDRHPITRMIYEKFAPKEQWVSEDTEYTQFGYDSNYSDGEEFS